MLCYFESFDSDLLCSELQNLDENPLLSLISSVRVCTVSYPVVLSFYRLGTEKPQRAKGLIMFCLADKADMNISAIIHKTDHRRQKPLKRQPRIEDIFGDGKTTPFCILGWERERDTQIRLTSTDPNSDQWVAHQLYWHEGGSVPIHQDNSAGPLIKFIMKFNEKCIPLRQLAVWSLYFLDYANKKSTS